MAKMKQCKYCCSEIDAKAKICPVCRKKQSSSFGKVIFILLMIFIFFPAMVGACSRYADEHSNKTAKTESHETQSQQVQEETPQISKEYSNALKKAERYAKNQHMSKARIYKQLTSEYGEAFSDEAATYAIENLTFNYSENALAKAKRYSDDQHMSKARIYKQLTSDYGEEFTAEEAQYAVDNLVADYKENALYKAKSYQDSQAMSPDRIYKQLTSEYGEQFTEEEAQYAIDNLN